MHSRCNCIPLIVAVKTCRSIIGWYLGLKNIGSNVVNTLYPVLLLARCTRAVDGRHLEPHSNQRLANLSKEHKVHSTFWRSAPGWVGKDRLCQHQCNERSWPGDWGDTAGRHRLNHELDSQIMGHFVTKTTNVHRVGGTHLHDLKLAQ